MSLYTYPESRVIDQLAFNKTANGSLHAYIHARDGVSPETLLDIKKAIEAKGWITIPCRRGGKDLLEVRGVNREAQLISELSSKYWLEGKVEYKKDQDISFVDQLKKRSLQVSGLFFLLGDVAYTTYGYKKGHWEDMLAGLFYFGGTSALLKYGQNDQGNLQIADIAKKMKQVVKAEGLQLPENCSLSAITADQKKGLIKTADDLLRRYPAETMNTFFGLAGMSIFAGTLRHQILNTPKRSPEDQIKWNQMPLHEQLKSEKSRKTSAYLDMGLGSMTALSGAISSLIEEKARDPDAPEPTTLVGKVKDTVQHKPLTVAGIGYIVSTLCHAASTFIDWQKAKKENDVKMLRSVPFRAVFVGANIVAEVITALSSKGHGKGVTVDRSVNDSIFALTAELIAKQSRSQQDQLIGYMSGFLGREDVLAMKDQEVRKLLTEQVEAMRNNPWACLNKMPAQPSVPAWQAKALTARNSSVALGARP